MCVSAKKERERDENKQLEMSNEIKTVATCRHTHTHTGSLLVRKRTYVNHLGAKHGFLLHIIKIDNCSAKLIRFALLFLCSDNLLFVSVLLFISVEGWTIPILIMLN